MSKRKNKKFGRKRALRTLTWGVVVDTMRASRRKWGKGQGR